MSFNDQHISNDELYFFSVFTTNSDVDTTPNTVSNSNGTFPLQDIVINEQSVYEGLCNLDTSKAAGIDDLNPKLFKNCAHPNFPSVYNLYEIC